MARVAAPVWGGRLPALQAMRKRPFSMIFMFLTIPPSGNMIQFASPVSRVFTISRSRSGFRVETAPTCSRKRLNAPRKNSASARVQTG